MPLKKKDGLYFPEKEQRKRAWLSDPSIYKKAAKNPLKFWEKQAKELKWSKKWTQVFYHKPPCFEWFRGGKLNITENCLDVHLKEKRNKVALIWEGEPEKETPRMFTYWQLWREVNKFANALKNLGVKKGDKVGIYLPMIPEAVIAMLSCARIGAVHVVVFSAFSPQALKIRMQDTEAKVLITADGYYRRGKVIDLKKNADSALKGTKVKKVVVVQRAGNKVKMNKARDLWWHQLTEKADDKIIPAQMNSEDTLFILYTSGCCHGDTLIQLDTGEIKKISTLVNEGGSNLVNTNLKTLKQNIAPIIDRFRYQDSSSLLKIKTSFSAVKVTPNHPLYVLTDHGEIVEKQAKDIKTGEHILQCRKVDVKGKKQRLPIVDIDYQQNKCNHTNLQNKGKIPRFLTPGLAQILGYFVGDGSLREGVGMFATDKDKKNLLFYKALLERELAVRSRIRIGSRQRVFVYSAFLAKYFKVVFPEIFVDNYTRMVPKIVQKSNNETVAGFLRGFFDAEGSVTGGAVKITSQSRELIQVARQLFLRFGILVNYFEEERDTHFGQKHHYHILVYGLKITDRESLKIFKDHVGFSSEAKSVKLNNFIKRQESKAVRSMVHQLPINGLLKTIRNTVAIPKKEARVIHLFSYIYSSRRIKSNRLPLVREYVEQRIKLVENLDFSKKEDIKTAISTFKLRHKDIADVSGKSVHTVHQYHNRNIPLVSEKSLEKFYKPVIVYLSRLRKEKLKILNGILHTINKLEKMENFGFFEVRRITKEENKSGSVYDIGAFQVHNYLANGFVVHNSTGKPKGTVHTCGGYAVQARATGKYIFDLHEDDVFWSTADLGWVTGHTYSCYSPLLNGSTFIMYEGSIDWPQADRWAHIIEKYGVTVFYTAPTAVRMFEKYGADLVKKHKFETLRLLGSVGEPIDKAAWTWYFREVGKSRCPIVDTWWQTETGGILITSLPGMGPFKPSHTGLPFPGIRMKVVDEKGKKAPANKEGSLVMLSPFSPGLLRGVYKNPAKYLKTYWSQYGKKIYFTSDSAITDRKGLIRIVGRLDDVIKIAGHRVTTGELESAISDLPDIVESAVIGKPDEIKGEVAVAFVVPKQTNKSPEKIQAEVVLQVRKEIGPIATPNAVYIVDDLPKTRSGKIMRRVLKRLFTGEPLGDLSTLANAKSVDVIKKVIKTNNH